MVALAHGRGWRFYAGPLALLLAATVAIGLIRTELLSHKGSPPRPSPAAARRQGAAVKPKGRAFYSVRAGDTISGIAARTGIPAGRLEKLNPKVAPTALFIGEKIRLR